MWLGTSSNWSFGRRLLALAHYQVYGIPLPTENLLFDGESYDLGWNGLPSQAATRDIALPTADFAIYLINAVKFHCSQLFHLFDEGTFMVSFGKLHEQADGRKNCSDLWFVHYLLVLAIGKALVAPKGKGKQPSGAELFVQAMKLLPSGVFLWNDPLQSIEVLSCAALYLQCLDLRIAASTYVGQAVRLALAFGLHTDMPRGQFHSDATLERCREIWWTIYILDCHMSALLGTPFTLNEQDANTQLPAFDGSMVRRHALSIQVKLAQATAFILRTVYSKDGPAGSDSFVSSMKAALKRLADINDEDMAIFPLRNDSTSGISRLSAHLHLFHHQVICHTQLDND